MHVLGIDGGGTKTLALVSDLKGNVLGRGIAGASNYQSVGLGQVVASVDEAVKIAVKAAGAHEFKVACVGLAGVGRQRDRALVLPAIERLHLAEEIILEHDAAIALAGATAFQPGVVVLAGTGAMAFGMNDSGERRRAGGWGSVLGDEGSAYYIGRCALAAACRAYDGRGAQTVLVNEIMEYLGLDDFTDIVREIYSADELAKRVASIAPIVSRSAADSDKIAVDILKSAADELALAAIAVIENLDMEDDEFQIALSGSVFTAGELLIKPFSHRVKIAAPDAKIVSPKFEPAMGAVFLALREMGIEIKSIL